MKKLQLMFILLAFSAPTLAVDMVRFESSENQIGLLELFTSEGCSSCPPADKWLTGLKSNPGLWHNFIPIALHVDYWDYIGWQDPFASPAHSKRQRQYVREQSLKAVYTPGFVYNGSEWRQWYRSRNVDFPAGNRPGSLQLQVEGKVVTVQFTPRPGTNLATESPANYKIHVALLGFGLKTRVSAGENRGKILPHDFVVLGMNNASLKIVERRFEAQLSMPHPTATPESYGVVAWISSKSEQRPIQAVGGFLPSAVYP